MTTIVKSPKAQLREFFAHSAIGGGPTAMNWLGHAFNCGDVVIEKDGGRHEARIDAILWATVARVTWLDTGWKSELPLNSIVKV